MSSRKTPPRPQTTKSKREQMREALKDIKLFADVFKTLRPFFKFISESFIRHQVQDRIGDCLRMLMDGINLF